MKNFYLFFLLGLFFISGCATTPLTPVQKQDSKVLEQHLAIEKQQKWLPSSFFTHVNIINTPDIFENTLLNYNYLNYGAISTYNQIYNDNKGLAALESNAIDKFTYVKDLKHPEKTAISFDIDNVKENIHVKISLDPEDFVYMTKPCQFNFFKSLRQHNYTIRHGTFSFIVGSGGYTTDWSAIYNELKECNLQNQPSHNINYKLFKQQVLWMTLKGRPDYNPIYQGKKLFSYRYMHIFNFITNMITLGYAGKVEITAPENVKKEIENNANKITYATMGIGDLPPYKAILTPENRLLFSLFAYAIHNSTITKKEAN